MLTLEARLDYSEVVELAKLAEPELRPLEEPSEELLKLLTETVEAADAIYLPSWSDALLIGVFLFEQEKQVDSDDLYSYANTRGITLYLEESPFAVIGLSTETLLQSSDLALFVMLHEMAHLAGAEHDNEFTLRFCAQLESYANYKQISQVPEG